MRTRVASNPSRKARAKEFFKVLDDFDKLAATGFDAQARGAFAELLAQKPRGDVVQYMAHMIKFDGLARIVHRISRDFRNAEDVEFLTLNMPLKDVHRLGKGIDSFVLASTLLFIKSPIYIDPSYINTSDDSPFFELDKKPLLEKYWELLPYQAAENAKEVIKQVMSQYIWYIDNFGDDIRNEISQFIPSAPHIFPEVEKMPPEGMDSYMFMQTALSFIASTNKFVTYDHLKEQVMHALSVGDSYEKEWRSFTFNKQSPHFVVAMIEKLDQKLQDSLAKGGDAEVRYMARDSKGKPLYPLTKDKWDWGDTIIEYKDGMFWELVYKSSSQCEGDAGGHCGNTPNSRRSDMILISLRQKHPKKPNLFKLNMTVIVKLDTANGEFDLSYENFKNEYTKKLPPPYNATLLELIMYESKGYANTRPDNYYGKYIDLLLWLDEKIGRVIDISGNHGYKQENNARPENFSDEQVKIIFEKLPAAVSEGLFKLKKYPEFFKIDDRGRLIIQIDDAKERAKIGGKAEKDWIAWQIDHENFSDIRMGNLVRHYGPEEAEVIWKKYIKEPSRWALGLRDFIEEFSVNQFHIDFFNRNLPYMPVLAMAARGVPWRKGIQAIIKYYAEDSSFEKGSYDYDKEGNVKFTSRDELLKNKKNWQEHIITRSEDAIQSFLNASDLSRKDWKAALDGFAFLRTPGNIIKAYEFNEALEILKVTHDMKVPKFVVKDKKRYVYYDTGRKELYEVMNDIRNGLDDYSSTIQDGYVEIYGDYMKDKEAAEYFPAIVSALRSNFKKFYDEHKSLLMAYHDAEWSKDEVDEEGNEVLWHTEQGQKIIQAVKRAYSYGQESAAYSDLEKAVTDYIKEHFGDLDYNEKTIHLLISEENFEQLLPHWVESDETDFGDYFMRVTADDAKKFRYDDYGISEDLYLVAEYFMDTFHEELG